MRTATARFALLLALLTVSLTGCAAVEEDGDGRTYAAVRSRASVGVAAARARRTRVPKDQYLAILTKRRAENSFQFGRLSCDLWAPFRCETSGGLYDPRKAAATDGAIFCLELDGRATNPLQFYGICSQVINGGLNVYAYSHTSGSPLGSQFFAGATEVDLAIEADGANLRFLARPTGITNWTSLAQFPFAKQTIPLLPALGVSRMNEGALVGFDNAQITSNGTAPALLRPEQVLSRDIWEAVHPQVRALHLLDGAGPDFPAATAQLTQAQVLLETAIATAESTDLGDPKLDKRVRQGLSRGRTSLNVAVRLAGKGKGAPSIVNRLKQGLLQQINAAGLAYPPDANP